MLDQTITRHNPNGGMAGDRADRYERFVGDIYQELIDENVFLALENRRISKDTKAKIMAAFASAAEDVAEYERDQYRL